MFGFKSNVMKIKEANQFLESFNTTDGANFEVPVEGALGLLALGDVGLIAWKLKKQAVQKEQNRQ